MQGAAASPSGAWLTMWMPAGGDDSHECYNLEIAMSSTAEAGLPPEVLARYEAVIGLEVHVQLLTASKMFCACSTRFGDPPNSNVCPVCLGLPGTLPVINRHAIELALRASLALNCQVQDRSRFARKNYFYPDLPKGYQISMYELPLATGGSLDIEIDGQPKRIGITRLHLEEDAAKALHEGFPDSDRASYVDYNRCGMPLAEIVSEPDLRSPAEAQAYLEELKQILEYIQVSDCNMEEGSLRCDANVSVRPRGDGKFGTKTEVKNLNSFRYLARALGYEIERQVGVIEAGGTVLQETLLWNVAAGRTESMRSKEHAHDYRYFPEPDLLPVAIDPAWLGEIRSSMPELPAARRDRFASQFGLAPYDARVLTATRNLADLFEELTKSGVSPKSAANWIEGELLRRMKEAGGARAAQSSDPGISHVFGRIVPSELAALIGRVESGAITAATGKQVFAKMFETGEPAAKIIAAEGLGQISDTGRIEQIAREIIQKDPANVAKFRAGNQNVLKFFVGQVMRATRGQANPKLVNETIERLLAE